MPTPTLHLTGRPPRAAATDVVHAGNLLDIETAREIVSSTKRRPWQGDTSVIRITAAHRVRDDVWNTLLKVLEEPPPHVEFHLYAPSTDSIPRTIKSRAHVVREHLPDPTPEDASRYVRLYEAGDALAIMREADRHTEQGEALRAVEGLWTHGVQTHRLNQALLSEYYLTSLRRGASPRVVMKALLLTLAIRFKQQPC
jgi:hypothetical protein